MRHGLALLALGAGALGALLTGCGSGEGSHPAGARSVEFRITDAGCDPHDARLAAGPVTFAVQSESSTVTEIEVLDGETILGEKENLTDGLGGSFSLTLEEGEYTLRCNGGREEDGTLTVTGEVRSKPSPAIEKAVTTYRRYLERNAAGLVAATRPFVAAVLAGEVERAKRLYPATRVPYERIEPVAGSFGDLDPRIDARENDVPADKFAGLHRLEKALWREGRVEGMAPVARQLQADVEELAHRVRRVDLQAVQIANGANELLSEVSATKISGEEERYSHIDLVDFKANVEGSEVAFEDVRPLLSGSDRQLAREIESDFATVYGSLVPYERGDGFVSYTTLDTTDTRKLAQGIDALAEALSRVPALIVRVQSGDPSG